MLSSFTKKALKSNKTNVMKQLHFLCAQPDDTYYTWQVHLWLENLRSIGMSNKAIVLIFIPSFREKNTKWQQIIDLYPEARFHFYKDEDGISNLLGIYIPVLRPYLWWRFFKEFPEMEQDVFFYCDNDVLFMKEFDISRFIEDDICYVSDANSYINASYFDRKVHDVLPEKIEEYKKRDVLSETLNIVGLTRDIAEKNNDHSGGAQYILKGLTAKFWSKMMYDCIAIRTSLQKVNREFFESENKGFQSWCADMWSLLWNLWLEGKDVKVIPELNFAWAPDTIEKLNTCKIYHNAGVVGEEQDNYPCFYKGKYHRGEDPMIDPHLDKVLQNETSKKHCTWWYASQLDKLREKYNLKY